MPDLNSVLHSLPHWEDLTVLWGEKLAITLALVIGGWVGADWLERSLQHTLSRLKASDPMLVGFFSSLTRWVVVVITGLAVLDRLGVQTSSILTILGAAGLAIGLALQNTLTNLAAGIMLLLFRPFRVGDMVEAGPISGIVNKVSLFHTELTTPDSTQLIAPNSLLWGVSLRNVSYYPVRRMVVVVPVPRKCDLEGALAQIRAQVAADPRIAPQPAAEVVVTRFNSTDKVTDIEVRVWAEQSCHNALQTDLLTAIWRDVLRPAAEYRRGPA